MTLPTCDDHSKFGYVGVCEKCIMTLEAKYELARTDLARLQAENTLQEGLLQRAMKTMSAMICALPVDRQRMADEFYDEWASAKTPQGEISRTPTPPSDPKGGT